MCYIFVKLICICNSKNDTWFNEIAISVAYHKVYNFVTDISFSQVMSSIRNLAVTDCEEFVKFVVPLFIRSCYGCDVTFRVTGPVKVESMVSLDEEGGISLEADGVEVSDVWANLDHVVEWLIYGIHKGGDLTVKVEGCYDENGVRSSTVDGPFIHSGQSCSCGSGLFGRRRNRHTGSLGYFTKCPKCQTQMVFTSAKEYPKPSIYSDIQKALVSLKKGTETLPTDEQKEEKEKPEQSSV